MNVQSGGFQCFACGAKGGDIIDFVRLRHGLSFRAAVSHLSAWGVDVPAKQSGGVEQHSNRVRERNAAEQLKAAAKRIRLSVRKKLHQLERWQRTVNRRLANLRRGSTEKYRGERELCWWALEDVLPRIRRAVAAYYILSFGSAKDREAFVLHPEQRKSMINSVLDVCYLRDDQGRYVEVAL